MIVEIVASLLLFGGAAVLAAVITGQLFNPGWTRVDSQGAILGTVLVMLGVFASSTARAMGAL